MPLTTASVPFLRQEPTVAESKTPDKPAEPKPVKLSPAGESGDAAVHNLMAQRAGFAANDMTEAMAEVDRQLAELGYAA
jgi:hypothetical protein